MRPQIKTKKKKEKNGSRHRNQPRVPLLMESNN